ncbi:MAG: putative bifunctional diguanylate cyclase/phosphodiesterase [Pseudomonadales bacterium]
MVDDVEDNRGLLVRRLTRRGYTVEVSCSGADALERLASGGIDLVLLDVMIPDVTGFDVLDTVRRRDGDQAPPIIMLTARDFAVDIARALEMGAADYVTKPFDFTVLEARVRSQLRRVGERNRLRSGAVYTGTTGADSLTGLDSRETLERTLARPSQVSGGEIRGALCVIGMDGFTAINDTLGRLVGDRLLKKAGSRLASRVRHGDCLVRLEGDMFGLYLRDCNLTSARRIATALQQIVEECGSQEEGGIILTASIGITPLDMEDADVEDQIRAAEHACSLAKQQGRNQIFVFRPELEEMSNVRSSARWAMKLQQAIEHDQLMLYAQPIIATRTISSPPERFEVLVRMADEGKIVSPGLFLPAAEKHGLAIELDRWVLRNSLNVMEWHSQSRAEWPKQLNINLSGLSLNSDEFLKWVLKELRSSSLHPSRLCFEITETAAVADFDKAIAFIEQVKAMGARFALDDFGSGASSFGYLQALPVDTVKIDGRFVSNIDTSPVNRAIVTALNDVAHVLGRTTVAEFVENDSTEVAKIGVDYLQGYLLGAPVPIGIALTDRTAS